MKQQCERAGNSNDVRWTLAAPFLVLSISVAVAYAPLVTMHGYHLWSRPHYQFFPVFLAGLGALLWQRCRNVKWSLSPTRGVTLVGGSILLAAVLLLVAASLLRSPWLAAVSLLLFAGALLVGFPPGARHDLFPIWMALWLLIPPPFGLETQLIQWLQFKVAGAASKQLDLYGINHLALGTTLAFPDKRLLVEEACSGIRSLFALVSFATLYTIGARLRTLRAILIVGGAVFWAYLANVMRVIAVAVAYDQFAVDMSVGWQHHLLGLLVFLVALAFLASSCVLVRTVLDARLDEDDGVVEEEVSAEYFGEDCSPQAERQVFSRPLASALLWSLSGICLAASVLQSAVWADGDGAVATAVASPSARINKAALPPEYGGWKVVNYEIRERGLDSASPNSSTWTYRAPRYSAVVSFDYPYDSPHNLSVCYQSIGWEVTAERVAGDEGRAGSPSRWPYQVVECCKPTGEEGLLLFCAFNGAGRPLDPPLASKIGVLLTQRIARVLRSDDGARDTFQVQVFVKTEFALTKEERAEITTQFLSFRDMIRDRWVEDVR